jgi:hypothetical protein
LVLYPLRKEKAHFRKVIAELIENDIITKVHGADMYIVNPYEVRLGNSLTGLLCLYERFQRRLSKNKRWIPTPEKDLVEMKASEKIFNAAASIKDWEND